MKPAPISRRALLGTGAAAALVRAVPAGAQAPATPPVLDDASRLNATPVARHWRPTRITGDAWLDALRAELRAAAAEGRPVALGAARHSMGGQALMRDGVAMTLDVKPGAEPWIVLDRSSRTFHVAPGARWRQVIGALDPAGFSPAVMQSNHDFGVAATFSVNAHGWPAPVRALRLDGPVAPPHARLRRGRHVRADREPRALLARHGRLRTLRRHRGPRGGDGGQRAAAPDLRADARRAARPALRGEPGRRTPRSAWRTGAWRWTPSDSSATPCSSRSGPWRARHRPRRRAASSSRSPARSSAPRSARTGPSGPAGTRRRWRGPAGVLRDRVAQPPPERAGGEPGRPGSVAHRHPARVLPARGRASSRSSPRAGPPFRNPGRSC